MQSRGRWPAHPPLVKGKASQSSLYRAPGTGSPLWKGDPLHGLSGPSALTVVGAPGTLLPALPYTRGRLAWPWA